MTRLTDRFRQADPIAARGACDEETGRSRPPGSARGIIGLDELIGDDDDVAIAAITLAELLVGVRLATTRRRPRRQAYVDEIAATIPILPYDEAVAVRHANLLVAVRRSGRPRGAHDLIIAATAAVAGRTIVSAGLRAFDGLPGVKAVDHRPG